jgi:hypothetical protein
VSDRFEEHTASIFKIEVFPHGENTPKKEGKLNI